MQRGPRSQRVLQAVRDATLSELARLGYTALSIDVVAKAAGVHRTTIYRRWPTKAALVEALLEPGLHRMEEAPDTGSLEQDLLTLMGLLKADLSAEEGRALAGLMTSTAPTLRAMASAARSRVRARFQRAFTLAIERGELPPDADTEALTHMVFFGAVHWVLSREPSDEDGFSRLLATLRLSGPGHPRSG